MSPCRPLIRKLESIHPLSGAEIQILERLCAHSVSVPADIDLVSEGDVPSECTVLLEGMVCRYSLFADGRRQIYSFHTPGDVFDAQSLLLNTMDHSVCSLTQCRIARVPHDAMLRLTEEYPRIGRAIWKDTLVDAAIFRQWMANIGRRSAYQRLAHLICELRVRMAAVDLVSEGEMPWPLTQAEMADAIGLSVVHVNRTLMELRRADLVEIQRSILKVLDWPGLTRAGEFDPTYLHVTAAASRPHIAQMLRSADGDAIQH